MSMAQGPVTAATRQDLRIERVLRFLTDHGVTRQVLMDLGLVVEMTIVAAAAVIAKILYLEFYLREPGNPVWTYLGAGIIGAVLSAAAMRWQRLYDYEYFRTRAGNARRLLVALLAAFLVLGAIGYLVKVSADYSRGWALTWFSVAFALLLLERKIAVSLFGRLLEYGVFKRRLALVGSGDRLADLMSRARNAPGIAIAGIYHFSMDGAGRWKEEGLAALIDRARRERIDEVVIALPLSAEDGIVTAVNRLAQLPVHISVYGGDFAGMHFPRGLRQLGNMKLLVLQSRPLDDWGRIAKSAFDRCGSAVLLLMLAPIFALIALAIRCDSPGPVFFCQRRHGLNHRIINVWKFRTMRVAEDGPEIAQATRNDPRVTRIGSFLRRTSLDELPQLWNVLRGEMSLVGPRPHALVHNEYYGAMIEAYANRHKVKPGMTGWAQVNGYRGNTEDPELMRKRVEYDLEYIERWSLLLDLEVLAKTVIRGFVNARAY